LTISLESNKEVLDGRGCNWSMVNIIAYVLKENNWIHDEDYFWNYHK